MEQLTYARRGMKSKHLVYVRKFWSGKAGWSDAIGQHYERIRGDYASAKMFEARACGPVALLAQVRGFLTLCNQWPADALEIAINHSISWWLLAPALWLLKRRGVEITLYMHEHEHILGLAYCWQHASKIPTKEWLRYCRFYHALPARHAGHVVVLSEPQAFCLGVQHATQSNYLKIDGSRFKPKPATPAGATAPKRKLLFPHDPGRCDKGRRFIPGVEAKLGNTVEMIYGRSVDLPYDEVYKKYWQADCVFLPSDWESYSLVAIEAMACNLPIVASPYVGILRTLAHKYTHAELEHYGVFISEHDSQAYGHTVARVVETLNSPWQPRTRELFDEFALSSH